MNKTIYGTHMVRLEDTCIYQYIFTKVHIYNTYVHIFLIMAKCNKKSHTNIK